MRKNVKLVISLSLAAVLVSVGNAVCAVAQDRQSVAPKRVVMPQGWKIPGLAESQARRPRHPLPAGYGVQGVPLQITLLRPKREVRDTVLLYGVKDDGETVVVGQRRVAVRAIIKCDVNEKVFLYIVQFGNLGFDPVSRAVSQSGIFGLLYYDDDGDGIFESRESGPLVVTRDLRIPDWVLKKR